jgi:hypothetical protein
MEGVQCKTWDVSSSSRLSGLRLARGTDLSEATPDECLSEEQRFGAGSQE